LRRMVLDVQPDNAVCVYQASAPILIFKYSKAA